MKRFSESEIEWLKQHYAHTDLNTCARQLGRTVAAIKHKVSRLGICKNGVHVESNGSSFCKKCKKKKKISEFTTEKSGRRHIVCLACRAERQERYYAVNRDEVNRRQSERHKRLAATCPEFAVLRRLRCRLRKFVAKKQYKSSTRHTLGIDLEGFLAHLESRFLPTMSWDNMNLWHLDHIKPCSLFDFKNPDEVAKCFHYTNIQPLWAKDNLSKNNRFIG